MKDVSLVRMIIDDIAEIKNISLNAAMDIFYLSDTCKLLSDRETGLFTYTPYSLAVTVLDELK
ncbi:MAG: hypothetical protein LBR45_01530 [Bacteroidales bacterium]|jgi:hypothetical protein|nr:hypothetical protein [Bacteroidales bacterium]